MLEIKFDGAAVQSALAKTIANLEKPQPMLMRIGEELADSTMKRFPAGKGPDGTRWAPKSATTLARHPHGGKRPLIGETGTLASTISYAVEGNTIMVGSNRIQSAVMQFGAPAGSLWQGKNKRGRSGKTPWGDIPARPYLGISTQDERTILEIVADYLQPL